LGWRRSARGLRPRVLFGAGAVRWCGSVVAG
jgi:hypothetical protein